MGVVLSEPANAGHAAELARLLEAIDGAELRQANRQISIAMGSRLVDLDVMRTVHRLEQIAFLPLQPGFQLRELFIVTGRTLIAQPQRAQIECNLAPWIAGIVIGPFWM